MSPSIEQDKLFSLRGKKALITGASSGLGLHFAKTLGQAGAEVFVAARSIDKLSVLVDELHKQNIQATAISLDVTDSISIKQAFDTIEETGDPARIIVNNAGISIAKPFLEQSESDWDDVINTNLKGGWLVAQEGASRLVAAQRTGSIINIASILGERVTGSVAPYSVSKAGVIQATKAMALELARFGITVNALLPGYVKTELNAEFLESDAGERLRKRIPSRRFGLPEHLDGPLLLLASDAGRHMTGSTLAVDGGHLISAL